MLRGPVLRVPGVRATLVGSTVVGVVLAAIVVPAVGPWRGGDRVVALPPSPTTVPFRPIADVLSPVNLDPGTNAALPTAAGLGSALAPLLSDPTVGQATAVVVDPATGRVLYDRGAEQPLAPASTGKLAATTAALQVLGPSARFDTTVVAGASRGQIVLVGGGDPTLSTTGTDPADPGFHPASLATLATDTAATLKRDGVTAVRLGYNASLYQGAGLQQTWPESYVYGDVTPVSALEVNEGRLDPTQEYSDRTLDPAAQAAAAFAHLLVARGIDVLGTPSASSIPAPPAASTPRASATSSAKASRHPSPSPPAPGSRIASVASPTLADLVEHTLTVSDNDLAEALARHVALATGQPPTFAGGANAVRSVLTRLGVPTTGMAMLDGSGLSRDDRIPARVLAAVLALDASPAHPRLRAVLSGLPIAGFTGTLDENGRYTTDPTLAGAGLVRAKTGSLTGVDTLAGIVRDRSGDVLTFAFMSNGNNDANAADQTLDQMAVAMLGCGCGG